MEVIPLSRSVSGPHAGQQLLANGALLAEADSAVVLLHGRGASAQSILGLASEIDPGDSERIAYLAPAASQNTWYPNRFVAPISANEPYLSSGLDFVGAVMETLLATGIGEEQILLGGFSQGACLAAEYVVRNPRRLGALFVFSGGLIGPPGTTWTSSQRLDQMPIFLGCSDVDGHIPRERVEESGEVFRSMGADVTVRLYPGLPHTINRDELDWVRERLAQR